MTNLIFNESELFESDGWKLRMSKNGDILKKNNVRQVLLVHGTFAGDNALGLFDLLEPIEKNLTNSTTITNGLKTLGKGLVDDLAKDIGN